MSKNLLTLQQQQSVLTDSDIAVCCRLHNLVSVSGLMDQLQLLKPRPATIAELSR